jgi:hypothetical protein
VIKLGWWRKSTAARDSPGSRPVSDRVVTTVPGAAVSRTTTVLVPGTRPTAGSAAAEVALAAHATRPNVALRRMRARNLIEQL